MSEVSGEHPLYLHTCKPTVHSRLTPEQSAEWKKQQAKARYIARLALQRPEWTPTEVQEQKLWQIHTHNALIAQDLAREGKDRQYRCASDIREMLRPALRRDVKFYGGGLGVVKSYSREQIQRILGG